MNEMCGPMTITDKDEKLNEILKGEAWEYEVNREAKKHGYRWRIPIWYDTIWTYFFKSLDEHSYQQPHHIHFLQIYIIFVIVENLRLKCLCTCNL